jgi:SAM-dependent methyltransferase
MLSEYYRKNPRYYGNPRIDIAPLLPESTGKVLEIGCGDGATLAWLRATNQCKYTIGIEYFPQAAEKARVSCDELFLGPVEDHIFQFSNDSFDLVLCLDVLEHLQDPWTALTEIQRVLRPGGILICSLPNIRHTSVILPLIFKNQWQYKESGIMDATHLRFFTTKSAIDAISNASFRVDKLLRKIPPVASASGFVNLLTLGMLTDFLAPQFLIRASK